LTDLLFGRKERLQTNYLFIGQIKVEQILGACSPWLLNSILLPAQLLKFISFYT